VLFDASQTVLFMHAVGRQSWLLIFVFEAVSWLPWVLATPLVVLLARRYPFTRGRIAVAMTVHAAAFILIGLAAQAWFAMLRRDEPVGVPAAADVRGSLAQFPVVPGAALLIVYALILGIVFIGDARERTARLNEELSKAQLAALRRQMEPHFMFNTLNSIAGMVREQRTDAAVNMIVGLSEFLRRSTEDSHRPQVTLAEEVEYLQRYVDIQRVRFGERSASQRRHSGEGPARAGTQSAAAAVGRECDQARHRQTGRRRNGACQRHRRERHAATERLQRRTDRSN
jgi:hypothetical protein